MYSPFRIFIVLALLAPALAHSAVLENPSNGNFYSGISVISGWKCETNGPLTVRFFDTNSSPIGDPVPLAYLNERADTAGVCGDTNNGFVAIWNYARLGSSHRDDGDFTAVAYDNGEEFARHTFKTYAYRDYFGNYPDHLDNEDVEFLRGAFGSCVAYDFHPGYGDRQQFMWNEATQHMEMVDVSSYFNSWHSVAVLQASTHPEFGSPECSPISFGASLDNMTLARSEAEAIQNCEKARPQGCTEPCRAYWTETLDGAEVARAGYTWQGRACYAVFDCGDRDSLRVTLGRTEEHARSRAPLKCEAEDDLGEGYTVNIHSTGCPDDD